MADLKTTITGVLAALIPWLKGILPQKYAGLLDGVQSIALALLGWFAADASKS